ncbi:uncharacterized protein LOC131231664 isoform X2 [Magnolia sinica]|uniref:uncharacterized protein LOC131231664 isoform X2 n=1 Tax=Magnolia sinica TaxID=86752 RepID=UPI00265A33E7|nr:uncharacterized protein LOC131231664 isoform X2 [Magnolia sinica]
MAVFELYENMYDIRLKPRLLKSLIKDRLPDEKHPFTSPSELSYVESSIRTHGLLSESFREAVHDRKLAESWKSAVDAWFERLLSLVSSKMPDKCWAGICLLGVTVQNCSDDRFLASYSVWFQKLLSQIQPPSTSNFVKVASCVSLSDLFTRLDRFPNVKKDGTSQAGKLIQPVLKLLSEDGSEAVWEGAVDLLCTLLTFFPSSVHRHSDSAESVIVSKIMSGKCTASMSKLAQSLALLPKARGDDDSWSLMMQKILISIHKDLKDPFQGLEEETISHEILRLLVPPGKDPPPPLGDQETKLIEQLLMPRVSTLMQCVCMMLTDHYPVQVTVPVLPLLALVRRILAVDGSPRQALSPFTSIMPQEFIYFELPGLHLCSLNLLLAVITALRRQLLPHAAQVVRLLTEYVRKRAWRHALPSIRIKVYSVMKVLLTSMGVGITQYLAQDVIENAFADLSFITQGSGFTSSSSYLSKVGSEALQQPSLGKGKHSSGLPGDNQNVVGPAVEVPYKRLTPISVQIAALEALEELVTVSGAWISEQSRSEVDRLLITIATNTCNAGWSNEERSKMASEGPTPNRADLQLTALHALLPSLLSPARGRPRYLSQGLELFRRGRQETGTKLAEFCANALTTLEVLIHPRALPLWDSPSGNHSPVDEGFNRRFTENTSPGNQKPNTWFSGGMPGVDDLASDEFCDSLLGNGEEAGPHSSDLPENQIGKTNEQSNKDAGPMIEGPMAVQLSCDASAGGRVPIEETWGPTGNADVEMGGNNMIESGPLEAPVTGDHMAVLPSIQVASSEAVLLSNEAASAKGVVATWANVSQPKTPFTSARGSPDSGKGKGPMFTSDSESLDSLPDIVVGDPDSD